MKVSQYIWKEGNWNVRGEKQANIPQLCLLFGTREIIEEQKEAFPKLKVIYPETELVICSSAGNIIDDELIDDVIIACCIEFEHTSVETHLLHFDEEMGTDLGIELGNRINKDELTYLLVLGTAKLNAANFLEGINKVIDGKAPITGGLAGDNFNFEKTLIGLNDDLGEDRIVAVSLHGKRLHSNHGSRGGWDTFGPRRTVTKCEGNVLFEVDNKPVLDLYKTYLGEKAKELPSAALHFPFAIIDPITDKQIVRGVQNTSQEDNSLILYGNVKEGDTVQLMRANFDRVIDGAASAAKQSSDAKYGEPDLSILISCVARRLVLDQLVEEELAEAKNALGSSTRICGFYSYSELSPIVKGNPCHLHNQTMTITSFYER